ncbi:response regulator [Nesterenkonia haasae]
MDDQSLQRMGTRMFLAHQEDIEVIGEASNGAQAVQQARTLRPDVVLMDIRMPGTDGLTATSQILSAEEASLTTRVLLLTTFDLDEYVFTGLEAGASGFLTKDAEPAALLSAIRSVAAGDAVIAPSATRRLLRHLTMPASARQVSAEWSQAREVVGQLTEREQEILIAIGQGRTNAEICQDLHLAESTVKNYIGRIFTKINARDRVQAAITAFRAGLVKF